MFVSPSRASFSVAEVTCCLKARDLTRAAGHPRGVFTNFQSLPFSLFAFLTFLHFRFQPGKGCVSGVRVRPNFSVWDETHFALQSWSVPRTTSGDKLTCIVSLPGTCIWVSPLFKATAPQSGEPVFLSVFPFKHQKTPPPRPEKDGPTHLTVEPVSLGFSIPFSRRGSRGHGPGAVGRRLRGPGDRWLGVPPAGRKKNGQRPPSQLVGG